MALWGWGVTWGSSRAGQEAEGGRNLQPRAFMVESAKRDK